MAQNEMTSDDDSVSVLDSVKEDLSEIESGDSDNEIGDNQVSDHVSGTSDSEKVRGK
jgi:hypothetical protein